MNLGSGGLLTFRKRGTKIRFGLASDLWKSGTKIRKHESWSWVSWVSSEERKKPKIRSGGLLKNNQKFIYTNT
ncbi:unnamed protein product [Rhizophagus irregularis]|nr:unnamed protein product [Rhizophagus irregularis]